MSDPAVSILRKMVSGDDFFSLDGAWLQFDGAVGLTEPEHALIARLVAEVINADSVASLR